MKLRPVNENETFRSNYYYRVQFKMEISYKLSIKQLSWTHLRDTLSRFAVETFNLFLLILAIVSLNFIYTF